MDAVDLWRRRAKELLDLALEESLPAVRDRLLAQAVECTRLAKERLELLNPGEERWDDLSDLGKEAVDALNSTASSTTSVR